MDNALAIHRLHFAPDESFDKELASTRIALLDAALAGLGEREDKAAVFLRKHYRTERAAAVDGSDPHELSESDRLRRSGIDAQRKKLIELRRRGEIEDDVFHVFENELDRAELALSTAEDSELVES